MEDWPWRFARGQRRILRVLGHVGSLERRTSRIFSDFAALYPSRHFIPDPTSGVSSVLNCLFASFRSVVFVMLLKTLSHGLSLLHTKQDDWRRDRCPRLEIVG